MPLLIALLLICMPKVSHAYNLFDPVPRGKMREMSMDRPDTTESPYSVDAGHYQAEVSFLDYSRDISNGERATNINLLQSTLKVGLNDISDFQVVFSAHSWSQSYAQTNYSSTEGFDDIQLRMKINVWGNDGGDSGLGFIPFVQIPVGSDLSHGFWQGGLIMPVAYAIDERWAMSGQLETDFIYDEASKRQAIDFIHTVCLGYEFTEQFGGFIEYIGVVSHSTRYQASIKNGFTWTVNPNWVLDAGYRAGLNAAAEDYGAFVGTSYRY